MSYIDELRERFLAAEERFGRINEAGKEYRQRLMGLMSRIEEEIRCRRDVEAQQAKEIERLSGENEELRRMLMSLLQAVESGDPNSLDDTLGDMDTKVAGLIGEGQGAPIAMPPPDADSSDEADEADASRDEAVSADDMMASEADDGLFEDDEAVEAPLSEDTLPENAFAGEDDPLAVEEDADAFDAEMTAVEEEFTAPESAGSDEPAAEAETAEDAVAEAGDAPAPEATETVAASEIADFYGAEAGEVSDEILPAYAHPAGDWDDFLNEDTPPAEASGETAETAETSGDPEAGSIRDLMDRVKSEVEGDAGDDDVEDDTNGGAAAAG